MQSNITLSLKLRKKLGETADPSNFAPINIVALATEFNTSVARVTRAARDLDRKTKEIHRHYDTNGKLFAARLLPQFFTKYDWTIVADKMPARKEMNAMNNNDNADPVLNSVRNPFDSQNRVNTYVRPSLDNNNDTVMRNQNVQKPFSSVDLSLRADTSMTNTTYTGVQSTTKPPMDVTTSDTLPIISQMLPIISQYAAVLSTTLSLLKEPPQIDPAAQTLVREALRAHEALKLAYSLLPTGDRSRVLATLRGI